MKNVIISLVAIFCLVVSSAAQATTKKDLDILGRALGFVEDGPSGNISVAVVHDPSNPDSKAHANEVVGLMGDGLKAGKVTLHGSLADIGDGTLSGSPVVFITDGLGGNEASLFSSASANKIIVVGSLNCVEAGNCVINVASTPSVKIYVSKSASTKASITFSDAFRMMITER